MPDQNVDQLTAVGALNGTELLYADVLPGTPGVGDAQVPAAQLANYPPSVAAAVSGTPLSVAGLTIGRSYTLQPYPAQPLSLPPLLDADFSAGNTGPLSPAGTVSAGVLSLAGASALRVTMPSRHPFLCSMVSVLAMSGDGTTDLVSTGFCIGSTGLGHGVYAAYYRRGGSQNDEVRLDVTDAGGSNTPTAKVHLVLTPPFDLALTIADQSAAVWVRQGAGSPWQVVTNAVVSGTADFRPAANLAATSILFFADSGSGTIQWTRCQAGQAAPCGICNLAPVADKYGNPLRTPRGRYLLNASTPFVPGSSSNNVTIPCSQFGMHELDPQTFALSPVARACTVRAGNVYGENSGCVIWDQDARLARLLIPNWGDGYGSGQVYKLYHYATNDPLSGLLTLSGGVALTLPDPGNTYGAYDPDLKWIGGRWYLAYVSYDSGNQTAPTLATNPSADPTQGTWTLVGRLASSNTAREGSKLWKVGGNWYAAWASAAGTLLVYDLTMTPVATLANFAGGGAVPSHPCYLPRQLAGTTQPILVGFDNTEMVIGGSPYQFTWGNLLVGEFAQGQAGYEFPRLGLPAEWGV